ncbi:peptidase M16 domain-containing protein [Candidatus Magnetobacterium bavaricum]|uniref:Peptidase M16 domain-containing protein n=1 Tax=Candidatus Magnetobacterium bavaricum TaxID=29290 RepID=A0A0F3GXM7_9BACT|nr:peptidase M16 domain-containing protein [Candidatus Magnetobacterium bavaricum]
MKMHIKVLFVTILLAVFPLTAHALDVRREVLMNGLTLLHMERGNLPVVRINLLIRASKLDEPEDKAGLANLTADMLLEGTKGKSSKEIQEEIEFMGASLDASVNTDFTVISLSVLKKDLDKGFEILADCLLNPAFSEGELRSKKEIVKGAIKQGEESPSFVANRAFLKDVYGQFPYGRPTEGDLQSIDAIGVQDLVNFHREHYVASTAILTAVGDVTYGKITTLIDKYMPQWQRGGDKHPHVLKPHSGHDVQVNLIDMDLTQANIILGHEGITRDNPDFYAVIVMNYILGGGGFSSRMVKTLRDDMGLAYDVRTHFASYKYGGDFQAIIQTKSELANTAVTEILKQIKQMKAAYVTDEELNDAKAYLTGSFPRKLDTMDKIANFLSQVEFYKLGLDYDKKYIGYIKAVTKDDVRRVAIKYLDDVNYHLVIVGKQEKIGFQQKDVKVK